MGSGSSKGKQANVTTIKVVSSVGKTTGKETTENGGAEGKTTTTANVEKPAPPVKQAAKETKLNSQKERVHLQHQGERPKTAGRGHVHTEKDDASRGLILPLLAGDVTVNCPVSDKIVRIFVSSTFTDTRNERNSLMERVYPRLKEWCQERGYQFQVVDMRWGVRDVATDDHRTTDLCLNEIELCKKLSTGPFFVTLLSHKYGYRCFPREFDVKEFETIMEAVSSPKVKDLLRKWFKKDENAAPATYVLQRISSQLPDFLSSERGPHSAAKTQWWEEYETMQAAIDQAAVSHLGKERAHAIMQSVTETEIRQGILADKSLLRRSVWFYRHISDIQDVPPGKISGHFKDCRGGDARQKESKTMLENLKTELMSDLPADRLHTYEVAWDAEKGISPETNSQHKDYINKLCGDFEEQLKSMCQQAIAQRDQDQRVNPLVEELTQHTRFCQDKCRSFHGRQDALKKVSAYLKSSTSQVYVIYGKSGCGKTSIVAMAAQEASKLQKGKGAVILRFLGTTPDSTTVAALLTSVIQQLLAASHRSLTQEDLPTGLKELSEMLASTLETTATADFPVTLILDSLDQLDPADGARQLDWLPTALSPHVHVIVSTLPEPQYEAFPKLKALHPNGGSNFYEVPTLDDNDVSGILDQWLAASKRQLMANQRQAVLGAFKACPLPLFLKLSFNAACKWQSHFSPDSTLLQTTVRGSINEMFAELEKSHGETLVSRALGYLTVSQSGLAETELEDILSCDDDVLKDVYTFWTPPVRRLPPLLLVRLKTELGQFLVDRGADGVSVFFWYHRQFIEAAHDRYCNDVTMTTDLHAALADYFHGTWAGKAKPYTDKDGKSDTADRKVSHQPLKFGDSFNLRKLNNLPYHATKAGNKELLKGECLLNFPFVQTKLIAHGIRSVLDDFSAAKKAFPGDEDIRTLAKVLQLSQDALQYDPYQLPAQVICRLTSVPKGLQTFLRQCKNSEGIYVLPSQQLQVPSGGQLVHSLSEHTDDVTGLVMTSDGKFVVTCSDDSSLCVIDVEEGRRIRKIERVGDSPSDVFLCCDDTIIVTLTEDGVAAYEFSTGLPLWRNENLSSPQMCPCGEGRSKLIEFSDGASIFDAKTGTEESHTDSPKRIRRLEFGAGVPTVGNDKYAVASSYHQNAVVSFDIQEKQFLKSRRMTYDVRFWTSEDDDDDFTIDALTIAPDGKHVICANSTDNNLYFLNIYTLWTVKVLRGSKNDFVEKFRLTPDGRYMYFPNRRAVRVFDLQNNRKASCLMHVNMLTAVATADMQRVVTIADDRLIRIWDLRKGAPPGKTTTIDFKAVSTWSAETKTISGNNNADDEDDDEQADNRAQAIIRNMVVLSSPRYLLLVCRIRINEQYLLKVYDTALETCVRQADLGSTLPSCIQHLEGTRIVGCVDRRMKVIDVDQMKVMSSFQGHTSSAPMNCTWLISDGKEIVTLTKQGRHLKIYNLATGKVVGLIKQTAPKPRKILELLVNKTSPMAVAEISSYAQFLVFDLKQHRLVHTIHPTDLLQEPESLSLSDAAITPDGRLFLNAATMELKNVSTEEENVIQVYDLEKHDLRYLADEEMFWKYKNDSSCKVDTYCTSFVLLDSVRVLSAHDDYILRVFNIHTGDILIRLEGHKRTPDIYADPSSSLVLTHGSYNEESSFRLWTKSDFTHVVSFTMDQDVKEFVLLGDHQHRILANSEKFVDPVFFHLHGAGKEELLGTDTPLKSHKLLFKGTKTARTIANLTKDEGIDDANDPDDDDAPEEEEEPGTDEEDPEDNDDDDDDLDLESDDDFYDDNK